MLTIEGVNNRNNERKTMKFNTLFKIITLTSTYNFNLSIARNVILSIVHKFSLLIISRPVDLFLCMVYVGNNISKFSL